MAGKGSREICVRDDSVLIGTKRGGGRGGVEKPYTGFPSCCLEPRMPFVSLPPSLFRSSCATLAGSHVTGDPEVIRPDFFRSFC